MRQLKKGLPLQAYSNCIQNNKPANWDKFSHDHREISQDVRLHILCEEQDSLCGYTELPINDPYDCHIDHHRKRSQFQGLTFDWENFIVATMDDDFGARYKDLRCGIKKADYGSLLNPVTDKAETYFEYTLTGDIVPKHDLNAHDKAFAHKTIEVFNLKHKTLNNRRLTIIQQMLSYADLPDDVVLDCFKASGFKSLVEQLLSER